MPLRTFPLIKVIAWGPAADRPASPDHRLQIYIADNTPAWVQIVGGGGSPDASAVTYTPADASGGKVLEHTQGSWRNTAAITEIDLFLSSGDFEDGSIFTLWGES